MLGVDNKRQFHKTIPKAFCKSTTLLCKRLSYFIGYKMATLNKQINYELERLNELHFKMMSGNPHVDIDGHYDTTINLIEIMQNQTKDIEYLKEEIERLKNSESK